MDAGGIIIPVQIHVQVIQRQIHVQMRDVHGIIIPVQTHAQAIRHQILALML